MYNPDRQEKFPKGVAIALACIVGCVATWCSVAVLPVIFHRLLWEISKPSDYYLAVSVAKAWRDFPRETGVCVRDGVEEPSGSSLAEMAENSESPGDFSVSEVFGVAWKCRLDLSCVTEFDVDDHYLVYVGFEEWAIHSEILVGKAAQLKCVEVE